MRELAHGFARELRAGERVLLDGPLGAGKSTFARMLCEALGVIQPAEGSPTFAIAHEYPAENFTVVHVDLFRIRSEAEIEERGLLDIFWNSTFLVLSEWTSLWGGFEKAILGESGVWRVCLDFTPDDPERMRDVSIRRLS